MSVGKNIRWLRQKRNLTQAYVAEQAGISQAMLILYLTFMRLSITFSHFFEIFFEEENLCSGNAFIICVLSRVQNQTP